MVSPRRFWTLHLEGTLYKVENKLTFKSSNDEK